MKTIFRIAKLELNLLFYSPVAWLLLLVFLFQSNLIYTEALDRGFIFQGLGKLQQLLTAELFVPEDRDFGIFYDIFGTLYLYLPLLTMGLISREMSSGTIKLLYSSPLNIRSIVLGKFVAMMGYCLLLTMCLGIISVAAVINIRAADYGILLSGMLAMYLLLCTYSAIGLFMSCLTSYQIVAAIYTLAAFALINYIGNVGQDINIIRSITDYLSITGRTENIREGLVNSKDVIYFLVLICMFLEFSITRLQGIRKPGNRVFRAGKYIIISISGLVIGYVSSLPGIIAYYDATATKTRTITPRTQEIIKATGNKPLEITSYVNLLEQNYWLISPDKINNDKKRWEKYLRFKPDTKFNYIYYYDYPLLDDSLSPFKDKLNTDLAKRAEQMAKAREINLAEILPPNQIRNMIDLRKEYNRYLMQLKCGDKTTNLRLYDDPRGRPYPSEMEVAAAFNRLIRKPPKAVFLEGEKERVTGKMGDHEYRLLASEATYRNALINQGFDIDTISLRAREIPSDITILVIADPQESFDTTVLEKLKKYIDKGGNMLIAGEPGKQNILNPLLEQLGITMSPGTVIRDNKDDAPDFIFSEFTKSGKDLHGSLLKNLNKNLKVSMAGTAGLYYVHKDSFLVEPILITDTAAWLKKSAVAQDSGPVLFSPENGDVKGCIATGLAIKRKLNGKEQRIVVLGDADCLSNIEQERHYPKTANVMFGMSVFGWLANNEFPVDVSRPASIDDRLNLHIDGLFALKVFMNAILPVFILVVMSVTLIKRSRR
jgi:ABC-2 type transport system permease protein